MVIKIIFSSFCLILLFCSFNFPQADSVKSDSLKSDIEEQPADTFDQSLVFEGRTINQINVKIINVAGPSVDEDNDFDTTWIGNITNALHFETREWVVRNTLLFSEGDTVNAAEISESERLLRNNGYFLDARIRIRPSGSSDSVTVNVTTRDRWTLTFLFSYDTKNKNSYFGFRDDNILGFGHKIDATITHDEDRSVGWGGAFKYNAMNVAGSYINVGAHLETDRSFNIQGLSFSRPFLTTELEFAGGSNFMWEQGNYEYLDTAGAPVSIPYKWNLQDLWIAKSYPLWFGTDLLQKNTKIVTSAGISRLNHSERPEVSSEVSSIFQNKVLYLVSAGVINQRYYKDIFLAGFGTTEDVPIGGYFAMTVGIDKGEFNERWYSGIETVYSRRIEGMGYFSGRIGIGGFRNIGRWEQNVTDINILYHSPLLIKGKWKYRILINNDYLYGFNRFEGEQIYLDTENGLRGLNRFSLFGTKRILLNSEALIFSPFAPLGFVLGGIIFADLGLIAKKDEKILNSKLYQGYGVGLRISNESIARANFEISAVYNPFTANSGKPDVKILFTGNLILGSRFFGFDRPSVINFNGTR